MTVPGNWPLFSDWSVIFDSYIFYCLGHGRRHGGSRVGKRPPWKKSGWAWPTLEILAVV